MILLQHAADHDFDSLVTLHVDLDHHNEDLRKGLVDWLRWMNKSIGFEGLRFDFAKGFAPKYTREYIEKSVGAEAFNVAEHWVNLE